MAKVEVRGATVAYPLVVSARQQSALAAVATSLSFGRIGRDEGGTQYVIALDKISLSLSDGDRLGLIGRNGSGKSTLLKLLAGIVLPRTGVRDVYGSIGCVLNFGVGVDPEKTGRENLKLVGRLYGLSGAELERAVAEAGEFTELGPYLDLPARTYSSGMSARLGFSIATARKAEILLLDEVIGTGDAHFVNKAVDRVKSMTDHAGIAVVATHSVDILKSFCTQAIWLDAGRIVASGPVEEVWNHYSAAVA
jgi:ABC-type polysaccharide/polyol phosphate transport system ATPase subunit